MSTESVRELWIRLCTDDDTKGGRLIPFACLRFRRSDDQVSRWLDCLPTCSWKVQKRKRGLHQEAEG